MNEVARQTNRLRYKVLTDSARSTVGYAILNDEGVGREGPWWVEGEYELRARRVSIPLLTHHAPPPAKRRETVRTSPR